MNFNDILEQTKKAAGEQQNYQYEVLSLLREIKYQIERINEEMEKEEK